MLLKADADGPAWTDQEIADAFSCRTDRRKHSPTMRAGRVRAGAGAKAAGVPAGPEIARRRAGGAHHRPAYGATPEGLCPLVVAAAGEPGRRAGDRRVGQPRDHPADAKKNGMTRRKIEYWVIRRSSSWRTWNVWTPMRNPTIRLALSCAWMSSRSNWSARPPIAATQARPRRVDYEYERAGTASVFLFSEPLVAAGDGPPGGRPACWKDATPHARLHRDTKGAFYGSSRPGHGNWFVASVLTRHGSWRGERTECVDANAYAGTSALHAARHRRGPPTSMARNAVSTGK